MSGFLHEWRACWMIARQGIVKRNKLGSNYASWLLLLIAGLCAASARVWPSQWRGVTAMVAVPLLVLALLWWGYLHAAIVEQNRCSAGRLVPGLRRRSLIIVFGLFAAITLVFGALFWPHFGTSVTPLAIVAILLSAVAAGALAPALAAAYLIAVVLFGLFADVLITALVSAVTGPSAEIVLLPLSGLMTLGWIYLEVQSLGRPPRPQAAAHRAPGLRVQAAEGSPLLRAVPARRDVPATLLENGAIADLMLLANGPARSIAGGMMWTFIPVCILVARGTFPPMLLVYVTALLQIALASALCSRMSERPVEQSLARLAPKAPPSAHFNGVLGRALQMRYLRGWTLVSVLAIAVLYLIAGDFAQAPAALIVFSCTLPAAAMFLRARLSPFGPVGKLVSLLWLAALLALPYQMRGHVAAAQIAITVLVMSAGCAVAWLLQRHMPQLPIAFPSTRLA